MAKKNIAAILIGRMGNKKPMGDEEHEHESDGLPEGLEDAVSELLDAIKQDDVKGAAEAFHSACQLCDEDYGEEKDSEDGE